jgi:hypothetical protein
MRPDIALKESADHLKELPMTLSGQNLPPRRQTISSIAADCDVKFYFGESPRSPSRLPQ